MKKRSVFAGAIMALAAPALAGASGIGGSTELNYGVLQGDIAALFSLATVAARVIGFALVSFGILSFLKRSGHQAPIGRPLAMILVGGVLLSILSAVDMAANSIFGSDSMTLVGVSEQVADGIGPAKPMFTLLLQISQIVGFLGFITGWIGLTKERAEVYGSIARILGGAVAMNAPTFLRAMSNWGGIFAGIGKIIQ